MTDTKHTDSVEKLKKIEDSILSRTEPHFVDGTKILLDDYKATLQATQKPHWLIFMKSKVNKKL